MPPTCRLQPLDHATLAATRRLVDAVFPHQWWWQRASWALRLSLMPWFISRPLLAIVGIRQCRFWVVIGPHQSVLGVTAPGSAQRQHPSSVLGVTGLYSRYGESQSLWLAWTCVQQDARGLGIGRRLIDFSMEQSRRSGAVVLKLYTTDLPDQQIAVQAYERRGFECYRSVETRHGVIVFRYLYFRRDFCRCEPRLGSQPQ